MFNINPTTKQGPSLSPPPHTHHHHTSTGWMVQQGSSRGDEPSPRPAATTHSSSHREQQDPIFLDAIGVIAQQGDISRANRFAATATMMLGGAQGKGRGGGGGMGGGGGGLWQGIYFGGVGGGAVAGGPTMFLESEQEMRNRQWARILSRNWVSLFYAYPVVEEEALVHMRNDRNANFFFCGSGSSVLLFGVVLYGAFLGSDLPAWLWAVSAVALLFNLTWTILAAKLEQEYHALALEANTELVALEEEHDPHRSSSSQRGGGSQSDSTWSHSPQHPSIPLHGSLQRDDSSGSHAQQNQSSSGGRRTIAKRSYAILSRNHHRHHNHSSASTTTSGTRTSSSEADDRDEEAQMVGGKLFSRSSRLRKKLRRNALRDERLGMLSMTTATLLVCCWIYYRPECYENSWVFPPGVPRCSIALHAEIHIVNLFVLISLFRLFRFWYYLFFSVLLVVLPLVLHSFPVATPVLHSLIWISLIMYVMMGLLGGLSLYVRERELRGQFELYVLQQYRAAESAMIFRQTQRAMSVQAPPGASMADKDGLWGWTDKHLVVLTCMRNLAAWSTHKSPYDIAGLMQRFVHELDKLNEVHCGELTSRYHTLGDMYVLRANLTVDAFSVLLKFCRAAQSVRRAVLQEAAAGSASASASPPLADDAAALSDTVSDVDVLHVLHCGAGAGLTLWTSRHVTLVGPVMHEANQALQQALKYRPSSAVPPQPKQSLHPHSSATELSYPMLPGQTSSGHSGNRAACFAAAASTSVASRGSAEAAAPVAGTVGGGGVASRRSSTNTNLAAASASIVASSPKYVFVSSVLQDWLQTHTTATTINAGGENDDPTRGGVAPPPPPPPPPQLSMAVSISFGTTTRSNQNPFSIQRNNNSNNPMLLLHGGSQSQQQHPSLLFQQSGSGTGTTHSPSHGAPRQQTHGNGTFQTLFGGSSTNPQERSAAVVGAGLATLPFSATTEVAGGVPAAVLPFSSSVYPQQQQTASPRNSSLSVPNLFSASTGGGTTIIHPSKSISAVLTRSMLDDIVVVPVRSVTRVTTLHSVGGVASGVGGRGGAAAATSSVVFSDSDPQLFSKPHQPPSVPPPPTAEVAKLLSGMRSPTDPTELAESPSSPIIGSSDYHTVARGRGVGGNAVVKRDRGSTELPLAALPSSSNVVDGVDDDGGESAGRAAGRDVSETVSEGAHRKDLTMTTLFRVFSVFDNPTAEGDYLQWLRAPFRPTLYLASSCVQLVVSIGMLVFVFLSEQDFSGSDILQVDSPFPWAVASILAAIVPLLLYWMFHEELHRWFAHFWSFVCTVFIVIVVMLGNKHEVMGASCVVFLTCIGSSRVAFPLWHSKWLAAAPILLASIPFLWRVFAFDPGYALTRIFDCAMVIIITGSTFLYVNLMDGTYRHTYLLEEQLEELQREIEREYEALEEAMHRLAPRGAAAALIAGMRKHPTLVTSDDFRQLHVLKPAGFATSAADTQVAVVHLRPRPGASSHPDDHAHNNVTSATAFQSTMSNSDSVCSSSLPSADYCVSGPHSDAPITSLHDLRKLIRPLLDAHRELHQLLVPPALSELQEEVRERHKPFPYVELVNSTVNTLVFVGVSPPDQSEDVAEGEEETSCAIVLRFAMAAAQSLQNKFPELQFRIALESGPAVGAIFGRFSATYDMYGSAMTTASALCQVAPWGTVIGTNRFLQRAASAFGYWVDGQHDAATSAANGRRHGGRSPAAATPTTKVLHHHQRLPEAWSVDNNGADVAVGLSSPRDSLPQPPPLPPLPPSPQSPSSAVADASGPTPNAKVAMRGGSGAPLHHQTILPAGQHSPNGPPAVAVMKNQTNITLPTPVAMCACLTPPPPTEVNQEYEIPVETTRLLLGGSKNIKISKLLHCPHGAVSSATSETASISGFDSTSSRVRVDTGGGDSNRPVPTADDTNDDPAVARPSHLRAGMMMTVPAVEVTRRTSEGIPPCRWAQFGALEMWRVAGMPAAIALRVVTLFDPPPATHA